MSMPRPTMGSVNLTVGPIKKPKRLSVFQTSSFTETSEVLIPPFKPNFVCALAFADKVNAAASTAIFIIFFIQ